MPQAPPKIISEAAFWGVVLKDYKLIKDEAESWIQRAQQHLIQC